MSAVTQFVCENGIGINDDLFGNSCESQEWVSEFIEQNKEKLVSKFLSQHSGFLKNRAVIDKADIINSVYLYIIEHESINQSNAVEKINKLKLKDLNLTYDSRELFFDMNSDQDSLNEGLNLVSYNNPECLLMNEEVNDDDDVKNIDYIKLSESISKVQTNKKQTKEQGRLELSKSVIDEYEEQTIINLFEKMTETQKKYWAWWFEYREQTNKATQVGFTKFINERLGTNYKRQSIFGTLRNGLEFAGIVNKQLSKAELERIQSRIPMQEFIANIEESTKYPIYRLNVNKEYKRTAKILVFADYLLGQGNKNDGSIKQQEQVSSSENRKAKVNDVNNKTKTTNKSAKILSFTATVGRSQTILDKAQMGQQSYNSYLSITNKNNLLKFSSLNAAAKQNNNGADHNQQSQQRKQVFAVSSALFMRSRIDQLEPVFCDGFA
jgi:hypothetical protein